MRHFIYFLNTMSYKREEVKLASTAKGRKMHRFDALLSLEKEEKFCCSTTLITSAAVKVESPSKPNMHKRQTNVSIAF